MSREEIAIGAETGKIPIDIMVPTHNKLELTIQCINSIYDYTKAPFHLIVVDDSTDLTPLYFRSLSKEKQNLTFIHSDEPFKSGNQFFNIAMEHCQTKYMATVMNSMKVEPDWENVAIQLMEGQPKIGVIIFKCLFPWGLIESAGITVMNFTPTDMGRDFPGHRLSSCFDVQAGQWAFAMLRVEACKGVLDEDLFNGFKGWDDIDNCFVVKNAGWKIVYDGLGVGYHTPRATRGDNTKRAYLENLQNGQLFYKRWGYWDAYREVKSSEPILIKWDENGKLEKLPIEVDESTQPFTQILQVAEHKCT
jgi:GT2 family glycosyltransferase